MTGALLALQFLFLPIAYAGSPSRGENQPAPPQNYEILLSFEASLFDQDEKRATLTFQFDLPAFEWIDSSGHWNLEGGMGTGMATVLPVKGETQKVPLKVRLTRYRTEGPLAVRSDGSRLWSMRGDLYLQAEDHPLIEMEFGADVLLPVPGAIWTPPSMPRSIAGEDGHAYHVRAITTLMPAGLGGGLIYGRPEPLWMRPVTKLPYIGFVRLKGVSVKSTTRSATERDADRLISRIQYVSTDYALAVQNGVIINEAEYAEQVRLLQEARQLAEGLSLAPEILRQLNRVRERVDWKHAPAEVAEAGRLLTQDLVQSLWFSMSPPEPGPLQGAAALYTAMCAICHGKRGDGRTPKAEELDPPPADFTDPERLAQLSPYRAFNAISSGIQGTGMPAFDTLSSHEQWSLAFFVFSFHHAKRDPSVEPVRLALPLEKLALQTDEELSLWLQEKLRREDVAPALAYLRTAGVDRALSSPLRVVRRHIWEAARSYTTDQAKALAESNMAQQTLVPVAAALRTDSAAIATESEQGLVELGERIRLHRPEADIRAQAYHNLQVLAGVEEVLADPALRGSSSSNVNVKRRKK